MFKITKKTLNWGGKELSLETGRFARQADGSVLVTMGGTTLLATTVAEKDAKPGVHPSFRGVFKLAPWSANICKHLS